MAKNYWLKLKDDYLTSPRIKKLRRIAGGDTYVIIYLKMQLLSVRDNGIIRFENIENDLAEELSLILDEDIENIKITISFLQTQGLIEVNDRNEYLLIEAAKSIGSESESAERVRKFRKNEVKALHCNAT